VSRVDPVRLTEGSRLDEHPRITLIFHGTNGQSLRAQNEIDDGDELSTTAGPSHVPLFGTWAWGAPTTTLKFFPKNKKGRNPGVSGPKLLSMVAGVQFVLATFRVMSK